MRFSKLSSLQRAFSCSLDKTFKVYDLPSKTVIKSIQTHSQILKMEIEPIETLVYLACDNLNVYQYSLSGSHDGP